MSCVFVRNWNEKINTLNIKGIELWLQNVPYNDRLENTLNSNLLPWEGTLLSKSVCSKPLPAFLAPQTLILSVYVRWEHPLEGWSCLLGLGAGIAVWNPMMCSV